MFDKCSKSALHSVILFILAPHSMDNFPTTIPYKSLMRHPHNIPLIAIVGNYNFYLRHFLSRNSYYIANYVHNNHNEKKREINALRSLHS